MKHKNSSGFTLVELMIVVAIVAILASIAVYNYGNYVRKANRTDARVALSQTAASLEKCRSLYAVYNHASCNVAASSTSPEGLYTITSTTTASTFSLTAAPNGKPQTDDTECASLTLTNTGVKGTSGTATVAECW